MTDSISVLLGRDCRICERSQVVFLNDAAILLPLRIAVDTALSAHAPALCFDHHNSVTLSIASGHCSVHQPEGNDGGDAADDNIDGK